MDYPSLQQSTPLGNSTNLDNFTEKSQVVEEKVAAVSHQTQSIKHSIYVEPSSATTSQILNKSFIAETPDNTQKEETFMLSPRSENKENFQETTTTSVTKLDNEESLISTQVEEGSPTPKLDFVENGLDDSFVSIKKETTPIAKEEDNAETKLDEVASPSHLKTNENAENIPKKYNQYV